METALRQARLEPGDVQHLNAHATSTPAGDESELAAIGSLFGRNRSIAVSATKSATGHLLGAAGGLEAIFTILALRDKVAPPTLNLENPDPGVEGIDIVSGAARPMPIWSMPSPMASASAASTPACSSVGSARLKMQNNAADLAESTMIQGSNGIYCAQLSRSWEIWALPVLPRLRR
jgi:beta-ketoacyl synthase-like protein